MKTDDASVGFVPSDVSRRVFLRLTSRTALAALLWPALEGEAAAGEAALRPTGPGARYVPRVKAAFVRRKGDYGILWPGAIYDGEAAMRQYRREMEAAEKSLGMKIDLRAEPLYSLEEAQGWLAAAREEGVDGLLVVVMDRQQHAWPTVGKAVESGLPTVVFSPVGTSFTTNTVTVAEKPGVFVASTSDFRQARYGLKMLRAAAKLREMRCLVIKGSQRQDTRVEPFGTQLRYVPAQTFLEEYQKTPVDKEIQGLARDYLRRAVKIMGATREDLENGIKSYVVARRLLEREECDGITMDCLGALGKTKVSLPCIAWSKMLDVGIPAACEADLGAMVTHALVQLLFDRPGFQQDPVAETARECLIGAHCSCPTRLRGFDQKPERYAIMHHHGARDAVPRPYWPVGQRVTIADVVLPQKQEYTRDMIVARPRMVIGTGTVVDNVAVPPAGGCVVSVMVKLDTQPNLLTYPGFHQLFFYGDFRKELLAYCQLFNIEPLVA
ncbi:hypothetical protein NXS98_09460 [Fontisphaera persica]|uniref:hypothetical protein n=1 Tax=Fontisphaera persica TaxID=2974023 RepID=UPI0024BFBA99|nr:hypothetical protein [Fontisphaera persica]WCJ57956.1 hypothetical protein NXS98_09460 [Fontisphaera persica]